MSAPLIDNDAAVGAAMTVGGSLGLTIQFVTQFASMSAAVLNVVLAIGGLYLLWLKIRRSQHSNNKRSEQ